MQSIFVIMIQTPLKSTLFPYTTLFRSYPCSPGYQAAGVVDAVGPGVSDLREGDRKSTRLNSSHPSISYAVICLKKKTNSSQSQFDNNPQQYLGAKPPPREPAVLGSIST